MREVASRSWGRAASLERFRPRDGLLIELGAVAGATSVLMALLLPAWLAFAVGSEPQAVDRLLEACQQGLRRGPFVLVGYGSAAVLLSWSCFAVARLMWRGMRDLVGINRRGRMLASQAEEIEFCIGGQSISVRLVAMQAAVAFSAGLFRPRTYVSTALLHRVSASELEATLLHELAHTRSRDPFRCWLVELVLWSLWFPRTSWLGAAHRAARESRADARASAAMGDDRPLLRALFKVDALSPALGICGLTSERERELRLVRRHGIVVGAGERAGLIFGLGLVAALMFIAIIGAADWRSYWFCPDGTSMQAWRRWDGRATKPIKAGKKV